MTALSPAAPWLWVGLLLFAAVLILRRPLGFLLRLTARSCAGLGLLALLQRLGGLFGICLGVNCFNAGVLGLLGLPGLGLLLMLRWLLRT